MEEEYVVGTFYEYPDFLSNLTKLTKLKLHFEYGNYLINLSKNTQLIEFDNLW